MSTTLTPLAAKPDLSGYIAKNQIICHGKPHLAGTRIRVQDIYLLHEIQGVSVDEIVLDFPQLTHDQVYAALAYFWGHREEILQDIKAGDEFVAAIQAKQGASSVQEKIDTLKNAKND